MKFKSEIVTQASGSIGGTTYSHAKGGVLYRRARAIPVNPATGNQVLVRSQFTTAVNQWINSISPAIRAAWNLYASNVLKTNTLGDAVEISGQNWFIATQVPRLQAISKLSSGLTQNLIAPPVFNRGDFTPVTATVSVSAGLTVTYEAGDAWANEDDAAMLIYQGRPASPGRQFFAGPYRLVGAIEGSSSSPPTSPEVISTASLMSIGYTFAATQNVPIAVAVTRGDNRLSTRQRIGPIIAT